MQGGRNAGRRECKESILTRENEMSKIHDFRMRGIVEAQGNEKAPHFCDIPYRSAFQSIMASTKSDARYGAYLCADLHSK